MTNSNQELVNYLEAWFSKNSEALNIARTNYQISRILSKNVDYKHQLCQDNLTEIISSIGMNMSELATVKFNVSSESGLFHDGNNLINPLVCM